MFINDPILLEERLLPDAENLAHMPGNTVAATAQIDLLHEVNEAFDRYFLHSEIDTKQ